MKVKAQARFIRQSPYKVRRVLDLVRGLPVEEAEHVLRLTPRAASGPIAKTLKSAVANAEHNHALDPEELVVTEAFADSVIAPAPAAAPAGSTNARVTSRSCSRTRMRRR